MKDWKAEIPGLIHRSMGLLSEAREGITSARRSVALTRAMIERSRYKLQQPKENKTEIKE
jgi:hypothetical protein